MEIKFKKFPLVQRKVVDVNGVVLVGPEQFSSCRTSSAPLEKTPLQGLGWLLYIRQPLRVLSREPTGAK